MIVVRDVFQLKYGKAKDAVAAWKEGRGYLEKAGVKNLRLLTDVVGTSYTLVLESSYDSLSAYEATYKKAMGGEDYEKWRKWYDQFILLVDSGNREIWQVAG